MRGIPIHFNSFAHPNMRTITSLVLAIPFIATAQTTHSVEVGGSTLGPTPPYYSPDLLTIQVGDSVRWTNVSGTHNVDGSEFFFPGNPEPFSSGETDNGDWTYTFGFTIPGTYNYHCDGDGHAATQTGRIFVIDASRVSETTQEAPITLAPSPATDHVLAQLGNRTVERFEVLGLDGRLLTTHTIRTGRIARIPVAELPRGHYIMRVVETTGEVSSVRFSKN